MGILGQLEKYDNMHVHYTIPLIDVSTPGSPYRVFVCCLFEGLYPQSFESTIMCYISNKEVCPL